MRMIRTKKRSYRDFTSLTSYFIPLFIMMSRWFSLVLLLRYVITTVLAKEKAAWTGWSCDDMTPNLCQDLQVRRETFVFALEYRIIC
jgi:hypothetical protein